MFFLQWDLFDCDPLSCRAVVGMGIPMGMGMGMGRNGNCDQFPWAHGDSMGILNRNGIQQKRFKRE